MENKKTGYQSMDEYISSFPEEIQVKLGELRAIIKAAAPDAAEKISYQMPTFYLKGNLVHFAAYKKLLVFIQRQAVSRHLRKNYQFMKTLKEPSDFP